MAQAALFAALTAVGAQIRIPFPLVPLTLQIPFVLLAGLLLGSRTGAASMSLYLLLGLIGLPVFAGGGGPQVILDPTFGFLLGYVGAAAATGRIAETIPSANSRTAEIILSVAAAMAGLAVLYGAGLLGLYVNLNWIAGKPVTWIQTLEFGFFPFIPGDLLKAAASVTLSLLVTSRFRALSALAGRPRGGTVSR
jgi:biotin transport system substrate-specific component